MHAGDASTGATYSLLINTNDQRHACIGSNAVIMHCSTAYLLAVGVKQYKLCRVPQLLCSSYRPEVIALIADKAAIDIMTQWTRHYNWVPL
jgi:hypothetical protein